jgi:hypothetical protein
MRVNVEKNSGNNIVTLIFVAAISCLLPTLLLKPVKLINPPGQVLVARQNCKGTTANDGDAKKKRQRYKHIGPSITAPELRITQQN